MSGLERFKRLIGMSARIGRGFWVDSPAPDGSDFDRVYAWLARPVLDGIFIEKNEQLLLVLPLAILAVAAVKALFSYGVGYLMAYVGSGGGRHSARVVSAAHAHADRISRLQHVGSFGVADCERCRVDGECGVECHQRHVSKCPDISGDGRRDSLSGLEVGGHLAGRDSACWAHDGSSGEAAEELAASGQAQMGDMSSTLQETFAGIRVVKAFGREDAEAERFQMRTRPSGYHL